MAELIHIIKMDADKARKAGEKDKATSLMTLYSEALMKGKNDGNREPTNEEVLDMIQVFVKNIDELVSHPCNEEFKKNALNEKAILEEYLPDRLSENQLRQVIENVKSHDLIFGDSPKDNINIGDYMRYLANNYPFQYDKKLASQLVREIHFSKGSYGVNRN